MQIRFSNIFTNLKLSLLALFVIFCSSYIKAELIRKPNTTFRYPNNPQLFEYHSVNLLPGITFSKPVCIRATKANGGELFVAEQTGRVWRVTHLSTQPKKTLFLDLSKRVHSVQESGFIGFELHPQFKENGFVYAFYTFLTSIGGNDGLHDRLSRFQFKGRVGTPINVGTELAMFTQFDEHYDHNGGDLHFGPDGYLYLSLGDEGGGYDEYNNRKLTRTTSAAFSGSTSTSGRATCRQTPTLAFTAITACPATTPSSTPLPSPASR